MSDRKRFSLFLHGNRRFAKSTFSQARERASFRFSSAMRPLLAFALALIATRVIANSPALTIEQQRLPSPAGVGATDPSLTPAPNDAGLLLTWTETRASAPSQRFAAQLAPGKLTWTPFAPPPREQPPAEFSRPIPWPANAHPAWTRFPDGSLLAAWFPVEGARIRNLHTARFHDDAWEQPQPLADGGWSTETAASEKPALAARDTHVVLAWLDRSTADPQLLVASSRSAGARFFLPVRVDDGHPLGGASVVLLHDGSSYVAWIEANPRTHGTNVWLRRLAPNEELSIPVLLATAGPGETFGRTQLGVLNDYGDNPARLILAYAFTASGISQIATHLIALPPAENFLHERPCLTCPPAEETLAGAPVIARVRSIDSTKHTVLIEHLEIPGALPAGETICLIDAHFLPQLHRDERIHARLEKRAGAWWLFDVSALHENP